MNCQNFAEHVNELARGAVMDAGVRSGATAHAGECADCAAQLSAAQSLGAALRALAASAADAGAPAEVEARLLDAFRARQAEAAPAPIENATVRRFPQRAAASRTWLPVGIAAAAAFFLYAAGALQLRRSPEPFRAVTAPESVSTGPIYRAALPGRRRILSSPEGDLANAANVPATPAAAMARQPRASQTAGAFVNASYTVSNAVSGARRTSRPSLQTRRGTNAARAEIATEFIPLAYSGGLTAGEFGQVVRVQLPRSALASLGLPANSNVGREGERVTADVVLGHDGLARAVRFVR